MCRADGSHISGGGCPNAGLNESIMHILLRKLSYKSVQSNLITQSIAVCTLAIICTICSLQFNYVIVLGRSLGVLSNSTAIIDEQLRTVMNQRHHSASDESDRSELNGAAYRFILTSESALAD